MYRRGVLDFDCSFWYHGSRSHNRSEHYWGKGVFMSTVGRIIGSRGVSFCISLCIFLSSYYSLLFCFHSCRKRCQDGCHVCWVAWHYQIAPFVASKFLQFMYPSKVVYHISREFLPLFKTSCLTCIGSNSIRLAPCSATSRYNVVAVDRRWPACYRSRWRPRLSRTS